MIAACPKPWGACCCQRKVWVVHPSRRFVRTEGEASTLPDIAWLPSCQRAIRSGASHRRGLYPFAPALDGITCRLDQPCGVYEDCPAYRDGKCTSSAVPTQVRP